MTVSAATRKTMAAHRAKIKALERRMEYAESVAERARDDTERERQAHARTRAQQQGFREGVEFAVRAMIREVTTWRGRGGIDS